MKLVKKILIGLLVLLIVGGIGIFGYIQHLKPQYSGELTLKGINKEVEVLFDDYGIPHIYARSEEDAYFSLGYVHAQDRLFQMEMMRRVGGGRLAEILGPDLIKVDRFFRTLGINKAAEKSVVEFNKQKDKKWAKAATAYLAGVNQFVENGPTPLEYTLIGIPKENFTTTDIYLILGYMSFNFAHGFRTDPIATKILKDYGPKYLNDLAVHWVPGDEMIHNYSAPDSLITDEIAVAVANIVDNLPVPVLIGSNGWAVGPKKTKSGKVIFANDTHIGYAQPSVWYEAHIEYPGFSFYGNHLAGFPFGLVGHTRYSCWGLTMFENDDVDFYIEKENPDNEDQVWEDDHWADMTSRVEVIRVKGGENVEYTVKETRHGPLVNTAMEEVDSLESAPVSVWWAYTKFKNNNLEASYGFSHSKSMEESREAALSISAPGLNVMYGDADGNIAWWAAAKLPRRPRHVNTKVFLDGASGKDEILGYFDSSENPQTENPPWGYVYSANNQPDTIYAEADSGKGTLYPGYYVPEHRAKRILKFLDSDTEWTVDEMKKMSTDVKSDAYPWLAKYLMAILENEKVLLLSENHTKAVQVLKHWNGDHQLTDVAPVIYNKFIYNIMHNALADEIGEETFEVFISTHMFKRSISKLINNEISPWWDDVETEMVETRNAACADAFDRTIRELEGQLGSDMGKWTWDRVHQITHEHPIGRKGPFDKVFNVGPFPIKGGNEVINNSGYWMNAEGKYNVVYGPAMRIIVDFDDIENSYSILPTGQSGNLFSDHYADQAKMYNEGTFRKQMMNREEIESKQIGLLLLKPE